MSIRHRHPLHEGTEAAAIARLRRSLIRLQDETRLLRRDLLRRKYNPTQPRIPAGSSGGGQWTSGAGGGGSPRPMPGFGPEGGLAEGGPGDGFVVDETGEESWAFYEESRDEAGDVAERAIVNRDGSTIHSEYAASRQTGFDERHTVTTPEGDKVTFETTERTQTIRFGGPDGDIVGRTVWTPGRPEPDATIQQVLAPPLVAPGVIVLGGAILFNWQSSQNGSDGQQAVMALKANEFAPGSTFPEMSWVGRITDDEVRAACPRMPEVESRLADAIARSGGIGNYSTASTYGTAIHRDLAKQVNDLRDGNFVAERSTLKEHLEGDVTLGRYGQRGTIRTAVVENVDGRTVCGYDIKTGKADLTLSRARELAGNMMRLYPRATRYLIMQIKPRR